MWFNKCSYESPIEDISKHFSKYFELCIPAGKQINHVTNFGKRIALDLKLLRNKSEIVGKATYENIKLVFHTD